MMPLAFRRITIHTHLTAMNRILRIAITADLAPPGAAQLNNI